MRVSVTDKLDVTSTKPVGDGYLAVRANVARSGVYQYTRREIGMTDGDPNELVGVYRSPEFTFNENSLATIAHKPVTLNHPPKGVSAKSWKRDAIGHSGAAVWESDDRKHVMVDMLLMDEVGVEKAQTTHREISLGYETDIRPEIGTSPEGEPYVAVMDGLYTVDHIACVPAGRAGHTCRIGDAAWPVEDITDSPATAEKWLRKAIALHEKHMNGDAPTTGKAGEASQELMMTQMKNALSELTGEKVKPKMKMGDTTTHTETLVKDAKKMPILILDGLKVDLSDEEAVSAAFKKLTDAKASAEAVAATAATDAVALADAQAQVATLTAEKATLAAELADARDPAKLRDAAAEYAAIADKARKLGVEVADADSVATIKANAVKAKVGDAAASFTDAQFDAAFATLSVPTDAKPDAFRQSMAARDSVSIGDAMAESEKAYADKIAAFAA